MNSRNKEIEKLTSGVGLQENLELRLKFTSNKETTNNTAKGLSLFSPSRGAAHLAPVICLSLNRRLKGEIC